MALTAVEKAAVVADYQTAEGDTGSRSLKHGPRSTGRVFRNLQFPTNRLQTDSVPSAKLPKDCSPHSPFSRRTDPP